MLSKSPHNIISSNIKLNNIKLNNIISSSNALLKLFCILTVAVITCILIGQYAFKNGMLTCNNYVLNTYLYIILSILLIFIVVLVNDQFGIFNSFLLWMIQGTMFRIIITFIIILCILIGLLLALKSVNPTNIVASNTIWALLILVLGIFLIPTIWFGRLTGVVGMSGMLTILITIVVGFLGYYYGDQIVRFNWEAYLYYALIILIIVSLIGSFLLIGADANKMYMFHMVLSIIFNSICFIIIIKS